MQVNEDWWQQMDEADVAQGEIEFWSKKSLAIRFPTLKRTGLCHYCGAKVEIDRIFCHNDHPHELGCADDYQAEQDARQRAGLR